MAARSTTIMRGEQLNSIESLEIMSLCAHCDRVRNRALDQVEHDFAHIPRSATRTASPGCRLEIHEAAVNLALLLLTRLSHALGGNPLGGIRRRRRDKTVVLMSS